MTTFKQFIEARSILPPGTISNKFLENRESQTIPPPAGTVPIPEGHVRLYHQTDAKNVESIRKNGLLKSFSKGLALREPIVIWASRDFYYGKQYESERATVEFHVPENQFSPPYHVYGDKVDPKQIIAIHEEWHNIAKGLIEDFPEGIPHDDILFLSSIDDDHRKAIQYYLNNK